jgi:hypothetical protein
MAVGDARRLSSNVTGNSGGQSGTEGTVGRTGALGPTPSRSKLTDLG